MGQLIVDGPATLSGTVAVTGAKNSALKLMAAALLAEGRSVIHAVPDILDVAVMSELLRRLGADVALGGSANPAGSVAIDVPAMPHHEADYDLVRRLRASFCVLGPLLARCGEVSVALPGGDAIGSRGVDFHLAGLARLGAEVASEHGYVIARAPHGLTGAQIWLDFPSVGATENLLMAAVLARGTTTIDNAAREPEIVDLATMLIEMGANIDGAGTSTIVVDGVDSLRPVEHVTTPDRIVAGTYAIAAVATQGDVTIRNARADHLDVVLDQLADAGAKIDLLPDGVRVVAAGPARAIDVVTLPYPGFPTDLQPIMIALAAVADGTSMITENVYDGRFMFASEMIRLGADIRTDGHHAIVRGRPQLSGAPVVATDIRAGAGLVVAGLVADGRTTIAEVHHIDRGYPDFDDAMRALGAPVRRLD
jgi:UDP-N-acetylglucosamine 1-carboxyvinyltransferase